MRAAGYRIGAGDGRICALDSGLRAGRARHHGNQSATPIETVVVTGIRASLLRSAQAIKKNATQLVDSISPVDINALPDRNVAEALQRVPGVTLQRTDANRDPVRYGGTGNTVFVRGLAWVQSLTNGRDTYSALNGRTLSWADVSASLLGGVDVYKNPNATMIEGGVGGVVDLQDPQAGLQTRTRTPDRRLGRLHRGRSDQQGYAVGQRAVQRPLEHAPGRDRLSDLRRLPGPEEPNQRRCDFALRLRGQGHWWSGGWFARRSALRLLAGIAQTAGAGSRDVVYLPNILGWRQIDWEQQRSAVDGSLQWRPDNAWEFTFEGFYSKARPKDVEHTLPFNIRPGPVPKRAGALLIGKAYGRAVC